MSSVDDRYDQKCAELTELQVQFDEFQAQSAEIEEELNKELIDSERQRERLQGQVDRLEEALKRVRAEQQSSGASSDQANELLRVEAQTLREEIQKLNSVLRKMETQKDSFEERLRATNSMVESLQEQLEKAQEEIICLNQEFEEKKEEFETMLHQCRQMLTLYQEIEDLKRDIKNAKRKTESNSESSVNVEDSEQRVQDLIQQLKSISEQNDILVAERDDYQLQLQEQQDLNRQLSDDSIAMVDELTRNAEIIDGLQTEIQILKTSSCSSPEASQDFQQEKTRLQIELNEMESIVKSKESRIQQLQVEIEELKQQNSDWQGRVTNLENERVQLNAEIESLHTQCEELRSQIVEMEAQAEERESEKTQILLDLQSLTDDVESARNESSDLKKRVTSLETQLNDALSTAASASSSHASILKTREQEWQIKHQELQKSHDDEMEKLEVEWREKMESVQHEHELELQKIEDDFRQKLSQINSNQEFQVNDAEAQWQVKFAQAQSSHQQALDAITREWESKFEAAQSLHHSALSTLQESVPEQIDARVAEIERDWKMKFEKQAQDHQCALEELKEQLKQDWLDKMKQSETCHESAIAELRQQLESASSKLAESSLLIESEKEAVEKLKSELDAAHASAVKCAELATQSINEAKVSASVATEKAIAEVNLKHQEQVTALRADFAEKLKQTEEAAKTRVEDLSREHHLAIAALQSIHAAALVEADERLAAVRAHHETQVESGTAEIAASSDFRLKELQTAHMNEMKAIRDEHAREMKSKLEIHETALQKLRAENTTAIQSLIENHAKQLAVKTSEYELEVSSKIDQHSKLLAAEQSKYAEELAAKVREHESFVQSLHDQHSVALVESENRAREQSASASEALHIAQAEVDRLSSELSVAHSQLKELNSKFDQDLRSSELAAVKEISQFKSKSLEELQSFKTQAAAELDAVRKQAAEELVQAESKWKALVAEAESKAASAVLHSASRSSNDPAFSCDDTDIDESKLETMQMALQKLQSLEDQALREQTEKMNVYMNQLYSMMRPSFVKPLQAAQANFNHQILLAQVAYREEQRKRRQLSMQLADAKGTVRVFCRVRPRLPTVDERDAAEVVEFVGDNQLYLNMAAASSSSGNNSMNSRGLSSSTSSANLSLGSSASSASLLPSASSSSLLSLSTASDDSSSISLTSPMSAASLFGFDRTFNPHSTQEDVFSEVEPLVASVLDGYNVCIFAYGCTGSGKTYTMEGPPPSHFASTSTSSTSPSSTHSYLNVPAHLRGLNHRVVASLFEMATQRRQAADVMSALEAEADSSMTAKTAIRSNLNSNAAAIHDAEAKTANSGIDAESLSIDSSTSSSSTDVASLSSPTIKSVSALSQPKNRRRSSTGAPSSSFDDEPVAIENPQSAFELSISVTLIEIYNEQFYDLLADPPSSASSEPAKLTVRNLGPEHGGFVVQDATNVTIRSPEQVMEILARGAKNRAVGATSLNERSSRSHAILTLHVESFDAVTQTRSRGKIQMIDLAGSENANKSNATGERLREAAFINSSLSHLATVFDAIVKKSPHIPFRNSQLTQFLQDSLTGQARVLMLLHISPLAMSAEETMRSLTFGKTVRAAKIGSAKSHTEGAAFFKQRQHLSALEAKARADQEKISKLESQLALERSNLAEAQAEFAEKLRLKQRDIDAASEERDATTKNLERERGARARETLENEVKRLKDKLDRELSEKQRWMDEKSSLAAEIRDARRQISDSQNLQTTLNSKLRTLEREREREKSDLEKEIQKLKASLATATTANRSKLSAPRVSISLEDDGSEDSLHQSNHHPENADVSSGGNHHDGVSSASTSPSSISGKIASSVTASSSAGIARPAANRAAASTIVVSSRLRQPTQNVGAATVVAAAPSRIASATSSSRLAGSAKTAVGASQPGSVAPSPMTSPTKRTISTAASSSTSSNASSLHPPASSRANQARSPLAPTSSSSSQSPTPDQMALLGTKHLVSEDSASRSLSKSSSKSQLEPPSAVTDHLKPSGASSRSSSRSGSRRGSFSSAGLAAPQISSSSSSTSSSSGVNSSAGFSSRLLAPTASSLNKTAVSAAASAATSRLATASSSSINKSRLGSTTAPTSSSSLIPPSSRIASSSSSSTTSRPSTGRRSLQAPKAIDSVDDFEIPQTSSAPSAQDDEAVVLANESTVAAEDESVDREFVSEVTSKLSALKAAREATLASYQSSKTTASRIGAPGSSVSSRAPTVVSSGIARPGLARAASSSAAAAATVVVSAASTASKLRRAPGSATSDSTSPVVASSSSTSSSTNPSPAMSRLEALKKRMSANSARSLASPPTSSSPSSSAQIPNADVSGPLAGTLSVETSNDQSFNPNSEEIPSQPTSSNVNSSAILSSSMEIDLSGDDIGNLVPDQ